MCAPGCQSIRVTNLYAPELPHEDVPYTTEYDLKQAHSSINLGDSNAPAVLCETGLTHKAPQGLRT